MSVVTSACMFSVVEYFLDAHAIAHGKLNLDLVCCIPMKWSRFEITFFPVSNAEWLVLNLVSLYHLIK